MTSRLSRRSVVARRPALVAGALLAALALPARAGTLHVPKDQPTIQAAVDAAADGDTIVISAGTYAEAVSITGKSGLILQAAGKAVIDAIGSSPGLALDQCNDVNVIGVRFIDGSGDAVTITDCDFVTLTSCRMDGFFGDGIHGDGSSHVHVDHCMLSNISGTAIGLPSKFSEGNCDGLAVTHCKILGLPPGSLSMRLYGDGAQVEGNHFTGNPSSIFFGRNTTTGGTLQGNHMTTAVTEIAEDGAQVLDNVFVESTLIVISHGVRVENNTCKSSGDAMFLDIDASFSFLIGNHITTPANGIDVEDSTGVQIVGNTIHGQQAAGVELLNCASLSVRNNKVFKAGTAGVLLTNTATTTVQDNALKACGIGVQVAADSTDSTVIGNHVTGSAGDGLQIAGQNCPITQNVIKGCHASGVHLTVDSLGNTLSKNVVHGSHDFDLLNEAGGANQIDQDNQFGTTSP
jgi:parallel beta-helix repeat protein